MSIQGVMRDPPHSSFFYTLLYEAPVIVDLVCLKVSVLVRVLLIVIGCHHHADCFAAHNRNSIDYDYAHEQEQEIGCALSFIENRILF